jgi:hypothetical protein
VKVIVWRPKIKAHSGPKRSSETEPQAIRAELLWVFFVSAGFGPIKECALRPGSGQPRSGDRGFVTNLLDADGLTPR